MKSLIKEVARYLRGYGQVSFSQEGEDLILSRIFENQKGFYVDVGAHHPIRFSNTYFFYKKGWHGINLDANPKSMKAFNLLRKRDINLEIPISDKNEELDYYIFNEKALNGFDKTLSKEREGIKGYYIEKTIRLKTQSLSKVLRENMPFNTPIDFLTVDVEGLDLNVLKSNDWNLFRPKIVLVEILNFNIEEKEKFPIVSLLKDKGYTLFAKTFNTVFFKESDF